ncbi:hypothetical protein HY988_06555 [Candidatus Micrarchaeota archaeon]|nr:hypothetical protein [Candidatus Micrarchaeota archaeon]
MTNRRITPTQALPAASTASRPSELVLAGESGRAVLVRTRMELSISLPLLKDRAEALGRDAEDARKALSEEREKMRLLRNKRDIEAKFARLSGEQKALEEQMAVIEQKENEILNPAFRYNVRDLLIWNRIDRIIGTQDFLVIKKASSQARALFSQGSDDATCLHLQDSNGEWHVVWAATLETAIKLLEEELPNVKQQPVEQKETLTERLDKNEVYQQLRSKRDQLLAKVAEASAELASLQVYMKDWRALITSNLEGNLNKEADRHDAKYKVPRTALVLSGGAAGVAGTIIMVIADAITTGGMATIGVGVAALLFSDKLKKSRSLPTLSEQELEAYAKVLCETRITELEERFAELNRSHAEALEHIQAEEAELRALSPGDAR